MRYVAPPREQLDFRVFTRPPLTQWQAYKALLQGKDWPSIAQLNTLWPVQSVSRFIAQTQKLLEDGLHYEQRIAEHGLIATREANWHDLFNALIWLRYGDIKRALNIQQIAEIGKVGPRQRTRVQCALTHFDEAGIIVGVRDKALLTCWDTHDWHHLFYAQRQAWQDGSIEGIVFGHALLEHALTPGKLLIGKALVFVLGMDQSCQSLVNGCARGIASGQILRDPQELRPLPLSGIPGWHSHAQDADFYRQAACFRPLRPGRVYPAPMRLMANEDS